MESLISPKNSNSDTNPLPEGYEQYAILPSFTTEDKMKLFQATLNNIANKEIELERKISDSNKEIEENKKELNNQSNKAIEIIGIFSAILALLIVDVSIIKSVNSFLSAILLIIALTCSMAIFAVLLHLFFSPLDKEKLGKNFWIPTGILVFLIIIGMILYFLNIDINTIKPKTAIPKLITTFEIQ